MSIVAVDYDGNPRRGLVARCRRRDGSVHAVGLADVFLPAERKGAAHVAVYRRWLGLAPRTDAGLRASTGRRRRHRFTGDHVDVPRPLDLVVLAVQQRMARCRLLASEQLVTLRLDGSRRLVPGQIATVRPNKQWRKAGRSWISGEIKAARVDVSALSLEPLRLRAFGIWDPAEEYWCCEEGEPVPDWAKPIIARGQRSMFEMEQVLPGEDPNDFDSDPILVANDLKDTGDERGARQILNALLRCLDAHAHLGNMLFRHSPEEALDHYEVGVRIGELSLGGHFEGVLAWSRIDNRPFLRCMNGYGLCLWRLERFAEAEKLFERMLWMNPSDNQGVRGLLPLVAKQKPWTDDGEE